MARAGAIGRVDTQVLLGDRVLVTELTRAWARVVVPDQATPLDARGYPVWIPRRQLTASRKPGDLVFFARNGDVHHIAIWIGVGAILEAPNVGAPVRVAILARLPYANEVSVSRRVLE